MGLDAGGSPLAAPKRGALEAPLSSEALVRPWRTATLVATLVAAAELILLLVLAFLLLAKPLAKAVQHHAEAAALAPTTTTPAAVPHRRILLSVPHRARSRLGVVVLNGNGRSGAAASAAATLRSLGYHIRGTANAKRQNYATTVVMYRPGFAGEGNRLTHDLHAKVVGPLDGITPAALHGAQLVVVLGAR